MANTLRDLGQHQTEPKPGQKERKLRIRKGRRQGSQLSRREDPIKQEVEKK